MFFLSSCNSYEQTNATFAGAMVGGIFGSSIGGLIGGYRGNDAGTAVGMLVGAAVGNAATAPRKQPTNDEDYGYDQGYADAITDNSPIENTAIEGITIEEIRFIDTDHNKTINANETCKLIFCIYNHSDQTRYDIAPIITIEGTKRIYTSPTAIVSSIEPDKGIRYTASIVGARNLKDGIATFHISLPTGFQKKVKTFHTFQIQTAR